MGAKYSLIRQPDGSYGAELVSPGTVLPAEEPEPTVEEEEITEPEINNATLIPVSVDGFAVVGIDRNFDSSAVEAFALSGESAYLTVDENGVLYSTGYETLLRYPAGRTAVNYVVKANAAIAPYAFKDANKLVVLSMNTTSLQHVGEGAFEGATNLFSISVGTVSAVNPLSATEDGVDPETLRQLGIEENPEPQPDVKPEDEPPTEPVAEEPVEETPTEPVTEEPPTEPVTEEPPTEPVTEEPPVIEETPAEEEPESQPDIEG